MSGPAGGHDRIGQRVAEILSGILPAGTAALASGSPLRDCALDSLGATRLVLELQCEFGVEVPLVWLAGCRGVPELAARVAAQLTEAGSSAGLTGDQLAAGAGARRPLPRPDPAARYEPFPLTPMQEAYLVGKQRGLGPDAVGCHLYRELEVADLDVDRLRASWQRVLGHHDMLRLVVTDDQRQRVLGDVPDWTMPVHDVPADQLTGHVEAVRARMSHRRYGPGEWPLFAIEVSRGRTGPAVVHVSIDALVTDGAGLDLLLDHWWRCYQEPGAPLPEPACSARDCVLALDEHTGTTAWSDDLEYWVERLADLPDGPGLLVDATPVPPDGADCLTRRPLSATLPAERWQALRERARSLDVSPTALVLTIFADTLIRHGAAEPFTLVVTTNQRGWLPSEVDAIVGPFTSSSLLVVDGVRERSLAEAARHLYQRLWTDLDHSAVSGVEVLRERRPRRAGRAPALPVVFTSLLDAGRVAPTGGFARAVSYTVSQTSGVALDAQLWEDDGQLRLRWDVTDTWLPPGAGDVLFTSFLNGLAACVHADLPAARMGGSEPAVRRPLNELQQAYFVASAAASGTAPRVPAGAGSTAWNGCQVYHSFHVLGLDVDRLTAAWVRMMGAYEVLRSVVTSDGELLVLPEAPASWRVPVIDLTGAADAAGALSAMGEELVSRAFPLDRWPQFDLRVTRDGKDAATVHLTLDLRVLDGRSVHFLMRELFRLYDDPAAAPRSAASFDEYAAMQRELRRSPAYPDWVAHWNARLAGLPPGLALPMPAAVGGERRRVRYEARVAGWAAASDRARRSGVSPDALLLAAFTEALATEFPAPFAVPVVRWTESSRRYRPGEYTALSWVAHDPAVSLWDRASAYQREIDSDAAADMVSGLTELRRLVLKRRRSAAFAYPAVYTGLLQLADQPLPAGVTSGPWLTCTPDVSLDCISMDCGDGELRCSWDVVEADFAPGALARMFERYLALVRGLTRPAARLSPAERHKILHEWNATARELSADGPVHLLFEEQARRWPDACALRWRGGTMTYRELNRRANGIAWRLRDIGVGAQRVVGICCRRGPDLVAAALGVLKAGGAYLPVEPYLPEQRAAGMLAEAEATALLTTAGALRWAPPAHLPVIEVDAAPLLTGAGRADQDPPVVNGLDSLAYVIYTSGSTGKPKGVAVTHRPLHNLLGWCHRTFGFDSSDVGLCVTSLGFDLSVFDILGLLGWGAALYVADEREQKDPTLLLEVLLAERITFWNSAPTTLSQMAPLFPAADRSTDALRLVFLSGDCTPLHLPGELRAAFPRARFVSLGGATEATVWSNYFPVGTVDPQWRSIPYGRPIDNCRYYILDDQLEPCPPGAAGDLYIAGACLSLGYVNQPELTARRFIPDPFAERPGERMYRTGDRATYFPDGTISFLGRLDNQVKIRGFRVELGEIEHRLRQHPGVKDAVVLARPDRGGDRKLIAYVIPATDPPATAAQVRQHAAQALADYMVPNFVVSLSEFPATANGKLDRDALPWPVQAAGPHEGAEHAEVTGHAGKAAIEPDGGSAMGLTVERLCAQLCALFAEMLGVGQVDPAQDLWDQGATSFTMVQVSGALQKRHQRRVPVSTLLAEPTVEGIARNLVASLSTDAPAASEQPVPPQPVSPPPAPPSAVPPPRTEAVDFFSPSERARFKESGSNLRPRLPGGRLLALPGNPVAAEHYRWRASRRDFTAAPVPLADLGRLLGLLRPTDVDGHDRFLYPSAGDTYAVQVYLHVRPGGVADLAPGVYYYRPQEHALQPVNERPGIDRSAHFYYNRPIYDRAAFELYLIGQMRGIEPLYGQDSQLFLALEAGYLGQLLMSGQAASGVGLCPIGAIAFDRIRDELGLDSDHRFLHAFLAGKVAHPAQAATGERPPYSGADERRAVPAPPDALARAVPAGRGTGATPSPDGEPGELAVIGVAGRYPGAADLDALWRNLLDGRRATGPLPAYRAAAMRVDGSLSEVAGGFLADVEAFDSLLFRIAPQEAKTLDPQLRLLLEAVWRVLEDAGYTPDALRDTGRVGVFVGTMWPDHQQTAADRWRARAPAVSSGIAADLPNRISHVFGFQGPSLAVDTSCSSSLTALHLAAQSLHRGECAVAVVAAVNLVTHPYHLALLSGLDLVATGGEGAFDADTSGWLPGEGVGAVLLRPAAAAARDRDGIQGIIEGTWTGHAGRTARFGAPDAEALVGSLRQALAAARVTIHDIDYVECAAAGAAVADAAEIEALGLLFSGRDRPVAVGTVKPSIGHLEAAAGISQLTKVLLQMRHRQLAPTVLAPRPSPLVSWDPAVLRVTDRAQPWPARRAGAPARALVNALGATGSYAHVVVRAAWPASAAGQNGDGR